MKKEYSISKQNLSKFYNKIKQLNKVAEKVGSSPIICRVVRRYTEEIPSNSHIAAVFVKEYVVVEIDAPNESLKYEDWQLQAIFKHLQTVNGNTDKIINTIPGSTELPEFIIHNKEVKCDHCHTDKFRNVIYIVKNTKTSEYKQVGSSCLWDFLGHTNPHTLAFFLKTVSFITSIEEDYSIFKNKGQGSLSLESYLEAVASVISYKGWISKTKTDELQSEGIIKVATCYVAEQILMSKEKVFDDIYYKVLEDVKNGIFKEKVQNAINWAKSLQKSVNSYEYNLAVIAFRGCVDFKTLGYAASLLNAYDRHLQEENKKESSEFIGTIKKREVFKNMFLKSVKNIDSYMGTCYLHTFYQDENKVVWFSSSKKLEENKTYNLKATVKKHETYRLNKQTVITRATVI